MYNMRVKGNMWVVMEWVELLSDSNEVPTHNHLVCKWTLNDLAKLAKWLSCVMSTYLHVAFDCMLLSSHVLVSEWIYTL